MDLSEEESINFEDRFKVSDFLGIDCHELSQVEIAVKAEVTETRLAHDPQPELHVEINDLKVVHREREDQYSFDEAALEPMLKAKIKGIFGDPVTVQGEEAH